LADPVKFPDQSINQVFTSPPYYQLRFYGTDYQVWGGQPDCEHDWTEYSEPGVTGGKKSSKNSIKGSENFQEAVPIAPFRECESCNAWFGELGWERDPIDFAEHLADCFQELYDRVLRDDGTLWVVISDTYRDKSLQCAPEWFAIEMLDRGWILRNKVIWKKPQVFGNPVQDRFIQDWEYVYIFAKKQKYYFDIDALRLPPKMTQRDLRKMKHSTKRNNRYNNSNAPRTAIGASRPMEEAYGSIKEIKGANRRCVWTIPTEKTTDPHFAPFPKKLARMGIKAGCPKGGVVLDPFCGMGSTLVAALQLERQCVGIDLSDVSVDLSKKYTGARDTSIGRFFR